ncbi:hypothetical protein Mmc1_1940 [Magnetococcus marinus MC-1]|uniref:Uncharacterized protein n=1 Tax=Magnetococcus marinus (strain ATCC BAA-1437 / JCM 17883 / MC-1) TaxID=156889 RepID=A0L905_MAGMM|nr:hypothetical protein [Magnetococcus marinus]ABK44448.1 hypothetical protein Mmc1_1940 [Magnetococcus marinus MC-1]
MEHGYHWGAILPDFDQWLRGLVHRFTAEAEPWPMATRFKHGENGASHEATLMGLYYPDEGPLRFLMLIAVDEDESRQMVAIYPFLYSGGQNTAIFEAVEADDDGAFWERIQVGEGRAITAFNPLYAFREMELEAGEYYGYSMAGLAYSLRPAQRHVIEVDEQTLNAVAHDEQDGGMEEAARTLKIPLKGSHFLIRAEESLDDYGLRGVVEEVDWVEVEGIRFAVVQLRVPMQGEHWPPLTIKVYASEYVLKDYMPAVHDEVEGLVWLQAIREAALV